MYIALNKNCEPTSQWKHFISIRENHQLLLFKQWLR